MLKVVNNHNLVYVARFMMTEIGIVYDIVSKAIAVNYQNEQKKIKICISRAVG